MIYLNLAPFKYKAILNYPQSPIQKIDITQTTNSYGSKYYEVYGWMKSEFKFLGIETSNLYGSCEATGTDKYFQIAFWKCISELVERWAFHNLLKNNSVAFGMDIDATSTGFAALPCWPKSAAREIAYCEAIERWAISMWWRGQLSAFLEVSPKLDGDIGVAKISISENIGNVVIVFKKNVSDDKIFYIYGFAYGKTLRGAISKASVELFRNEKVLLQNNAAEAKSVSDIRLKYFSTEEGFLHFFSKVGSIGRIFNSIPNLIVDSEVPGEWSQFATVWRCLLPDTNYNWNDLKHFMF